MTNPTDHPISGDESLQQFLDSIPSPKQIRERIAQNAHETTLLKRLLKLAEDADLARKVEENPSFRATNSPSVGVAQ